MEGLTEGRMVHYVNENGQHHPAIVCRVWDRQTGLVNLAIFNDSGVPYQRTSVQFEAILGTEHEKALANRWHWIEKA